ncbi:MAG: SUMF1/EgtB/PvdO family nonheme iron enzyme [Nitrosomonas sp.]|uniref:SUMF1/EgtB/PvdO family nonheme iron enzyme n=1 Tax=Nitrosomonas sp. TaxID=42353 RepID=UPI001D8241AC|nr:SUMF1/EgtB/PvdO family nonheme iron enzyme [Nitrosomonas sp.]MBX9894702.1 SUMF1/EgtB/PvdO family nonheme iron enzyme [Nitrosomonas sp.]
MERHDSLKDFFAQLDAVLRAEDMMYGPDVWLRVHQLALRLNYYHAPPADLRQLLPVLRPLFCRNPEEQARFAFLFEQCLSEKPQSLASVNRIDSPQQRAIDDSLEKAARIKRYWLWSGILLLIALVTVMPKPQKIEEPPKSPATIAQSDKKTDTTPSSSPSPSASETGTPAPVISIIAPQPLPEPEPDPAENLPWYWYGLPWLMAAWWLAARFHQKLKLSRGNNSGDDRINKIAFDQQFTPIWGGVDAEKSLRELRAARLIPTRRLDIDATIEATARNGDYFQPVYRTRRIAPEHVLLVRSLSRHDQQAELAEELADRFKSLGLQVHIYRFRDDPRWLANWDDNGASTYFDLTQIQAKHGNARLLIISESDIVFHPYSGEPRAWLSALSPWQDKAWLHPYDAREVHADLLAKRDFVVLPLSRDSLPELVSHLTAAETAKPAAAKTGYIELPDIIAREPDGWLGEQPPYGTDLADLEWELEYFLGTHGMRLLRAIAVYPKPQWKLTLALDYLLFGKLGTADPPARREQRLSRLSRLPWLMHGFMPNWLREYLLINCDADERQHVVAVWQSLFGQLNEHGRKSLQLDFSTPSQRQIKLYWNQLRLMPQSDAINDPIFVHILMGGRFGWLDFHLPRALARRLPFAQRALDLRPVLGAIAGAMLGMAAIFVIDRYFAEPPFEPAQWQVTVQYQTNVQPLAIALQQYLQQDQFKVAQPGEMSDASIKNHSILYPPGGSKAADRIKRRLVWLAYGADVVTEQSPELRKQTIQVLLTDLYAVAFNDELRDAAKVDPEPPPKKQVIEPTAVIVPKPLKKPVIKIVSANPEQSLEKLPKNILPNHTEDRSASIPNENPIVVIEPEMVRIIPPEKGEIQLEEKVSNLLGSFSFPQPFVMSRHKITVSQFRQFVQDTSYVTTAELHGKGCISFKNMKNESNNNWKKPGFEQSDDHPVVCVTWNDAQAYVKWLSDKMGKQYRLLTYMESTYVILFRNLLKIRPSLLKNDGVKNQFKKISEDMPLDFGVIKSSMLELTQECVSFAQVMGKDRGDCDRTVVLKDDLSDLESPSEAARILNSDDSINNLGFRIARDF